VPVVAANATAMAVSVFVIFILRSPVLLQVYRLLRLF